MRRITFALALIGLFSSLAIAQTRPGTTPLQTPQADAPQAVAKQSDLDEASRLSIEVVKLYNQKQYNHAVPLAKRALKLREDALGKEHILVAGALVNLASLYIQTKEFGSAGALCKRALSIYEKALGPENLGLTRTLDTCAWASYFSGDAGKAEELFLRSLSIREKSLGPAHIDVANSTQNLARFYQKRGSYSKSLKYYQEALAAKEKLLGPNHQEVAEALDQYACAMRQLDNIKEAEALQMRAFKIRWGLSDGPPNIEYLSSVIIQGKAVHRAEPIYPMSARHKGLSGTAIIEVTVDESGKVIEARIVCGPDLLAAAALEAARRWRFAPTSIRGIPVKVIGTITFNFRV